MTTLKSFQAEIEAISQEKHKLAIKEAREAHAAAELARHHGKLPPKKDAAAASSSAAKVVDHGDNGAEAAEEAEEIPLEVSELSHTAIDSTLIPAGPHHVRRRGGGAAIALSFLVITEAWRDPHHARRSPDPVSHLQPSQPRCAGHPYNRQGHYS